MHRPAEYSVGDEALLYDIISVKANGVDDTITINHRHNDAIQNSAFRGNQMKTVLLLNEVLPYMKKIFKDNSIGCFGKADRFIAHGDSNQVEKKKSSGTGMKFSPAAQIFLKLLYSLN